MNPDLSYQQYQDWDVSIYRSRAMRNFTMVEDTLPDHQDELKRPYRLHLTCTRPDADPYNEEHESLGSAIALFYKDAKGSPLFHARLINPTARTCIWQRGGWIYVDSIIRGVTRLQLPRTRSESSLRMSVACVSSTSSRIALYRRPRIASMWHSATYGGHLPTCLYAQRLF